MKADQLDHLVNPPPPDTAGASFVSSLRATTSLSPWIGLGVLVAWAGALGAVAAVRVVRSDA